VSQLARSAGITLAPGVTFLVGENGTGKSTLVEAVAAAAGFNPEGGSRNFRFATRASESSLGERLRLTWGVHKPRTEFFLRAESFYNVASEIERLDRDSGGFGRPLLDSYGGVSPHERSHGESFLDLAVNRFGPEGLYLLDEPEAALSVRGCLALLSRMHELVGQGNCSSPPTPPCCWRSPAPPSWRSPRTARSNASTSTRPSRSGSPASSSPRRTASCGPCSGTDAPSGRPPTGGLGQAGVDRDGCAGRGLGSESAVMVSDQLPV